MLCVMCIVLCVLCYVYCVMCYVLCVLCYVLCVVCIVCEERDLPMHISSKYVRLFNSLGTLARYLVKQ